ncbi:hypothetical protein NGB36_09395 [Streptomyces sp. RB6PN25]|uniref:Uncharacterized protein n=1 Tax=Streptomyces humicola TaxID=2953240 RepID=A0ABT1PT01_9ACTN|nr:hypothetical protein [Streptomyces humicola]MCQ4080809.1 hypothetical protein [Streptomyces humicola]
MLTLILIVVAGVSLLLGWLLGITPLVYVALGVSALGLILIGGDAWLRRRRAAQAEESDPDAADADEADDEDGKAAEDGADADTAVAASAASSTSRVRGWAAKAKPKAVPAPAATENDAGGDAADEPLTDDSVVLVVAGRRRFHTPGCSTLDGKGPEELTVAEAREESFTPCTICVGAATKKELARRPR